MLFGVGNAIIAHNVNFFNRKIKNLIMGVKK
jgi:hypothetical protein